MSVKLAFWDSSALVPLCVSQAETAMARAFYKNFGMAVWWAAPVEIVSALTRILRMGQIGSVQFGESKKTAEGLARKWVMIGPSPEIAATACSLLELHHLSAADALQLAAALAWCGGDPKGKVFLTLDQRLRAAAGMTGFTLA